MNLSEQISQDDDVGARNMASGDSINHSNLGYEADALDEGAVSAAMGGVIENNPPEAVYATMPGSELVIPDGEDSSQLTLSFRGQVYVFDGVTPKKVIAFLSKLCR